MHVFKKAENDIGIEITISTYSTNKSCHLNENKITTYFYACIMLTGYL